MTLGSHSGFSSNVSSQFVEGLNRSASSTTQDARANGSTQPRNSPMNLDTSSSSIISVVRLTTGCLPIMPVSWTCASIPIQILTAKYGDSVTSASQMCDGDSLHSLPQPYVILPCSRWGLRSRFPIEPNKL